MGDVDHDVPGHMDRGLIKSSIVSVVTIAGLETKVWGDAMRTMQIL